jgi:hypothetical protein
MQFSLREVAEMLNRAGKTSVALCEFTAKVIHYACRKCKQLASTLNASELYLEGRRTRFNSRLVTDYPD